ncbi:putative transcription factor Nin-like family [Helianthus debilis subsp. tardiflorus]
MVPIRFPFQSNCIGVLEFNFALAECQLGRFLFNTVEAIKRAGLDSFYVQHLIPYKAISGLEVAKDEIEEALKVVCQSHNLALAQVWIPYEDKFSYSLEDSKTKRLLAIKLTGCVYAVTNYECERFDAYLRFGDVTPRAIEEELLLVTLQDYKSRYISKLRSNKLIGWNCGLLRPPCALAICLRSNDTADFNYAFEFIWTQHSNKVIFLEAILLTLKRCLPRFKFASGAELGDELDVILVDSSTDNETQKLKIFQEKRSSLIPAAPEKGKSPTVMELIAPSEVTYKTATKVLPREVNEKQFGKTMKKAAKDLNEWPGPNFVKRNRNDSSVIQINTNEEDNGGEPGDVFDVIVVQDATHNEACEISESERIKIFQEKRSSPMPIAPEKGKNPMVDLIAPAKVTCKTAPKVLPREVIEKHFGKTMKEAAKDLNVSLSTLKRKVKELKIPEWRGPNVVKRNRNDSSIIQINTNEEENGAIDQGISALNLNKDVLTLKAEYLAKIIKLHLPISQAKFVAVQEKIGMKLKLSVGTFELEYIDEDKEWISLTSDEDMNDCIQSSRKRMRVLPSPQPISGPSGSLGTFSV